MDSYPGESAADLAFHTPSQSLGCEVSGQAVWCRNLNMSYQGSDVGGQLQIASVGGRVSTGAATDGPMFTMPGAPSLGYGQVRYAGSVVCASSRDGLTAWDTRTGHGFFLNKTQVAAL